MDLGDFKAAELTCPETTTEYAQGFFTPFQNMKNWKSRKHKCSAPKTPRQHINYIKPSYTPGLHVKAGSNPPVDRDVETPAKAHSRDLLIPIRASIFRLLPYNNNHQHHSNAAATATAAAAATTTVAAATATATAAAAATTPTTTVAAATATARETACAAF